ncbi:hypothetical protein TNCV_1964431 [Trichonephila clavipes]|nr:hypothetical protein TNCV_1964431 [Trichonephila clavipes]
MLFGREGTNGDWDKILGCCVPAHVLPDQESKGRKRISPGWFKQTDEKVEERRQVRLHESRQPIGRLRKTCKSAFHRTIPVSFGRLDTSIATESCL